MHHRDLLIISAPAVLYLLLIFIIQRLRPKMPRLDQFIDLCNDYLEHLLFPSKYLKATPTAPRQYSFAHRVCLHEAGHAIVGFFCTHVKEIESISINRDEGGLVRSRYRIDSIRGRWADLVISIAGLTTELDYYGRTMMKCSETDLKHCWEDAKQLNQQQQTIPPWSAIPQLPLPKHPVFDQLTPIQHSIMRHGYSMARYLLQAHRSKFDQLVKVLIDRQKQDGDYIMLSDDIKQVLGERWMITSLLASSDNTLFFFPAVKT